MDEIFINSNIMTVNKNLRYLYETNPNIQAFIDLTAQIIFGISRNDRNTEIYDDNFLHRIITEYLLIGRVVVDYFVKDNYHQIYDPNNYIVYHLPGSSRIKVITGETEITQKIVYLKRSTHLYDYLGAPIVSENGEFVNAFSFYSFIMELSNALSMREAETGKYVE